MTDFTAAVQKPGAAGVAPVYSALTGTDKFAATRNARYLLHYKNGATAMGAGALTVGDNATPIPGGSAAVAGFADQVTVPTPMGASSELVALIDGSDRFRDSQGFINLLKTGSPVFTTMTVAIIGPL
jgi:hypothetical protein